MKIEDFLKEVRINLVGNRERFIRSSWLNAYEWCPFQVKMDIEGVEVKKELADVGKEKHEIIAESIAKDIEFEKAPMKEIVKNLNSSTTMLKPDSSHFFAKYKGYFIWGIPDLVFSINGKCYVIDFKTHKKPNIYNGDKLQMLSYLYLAQYLGIKNLTGLVCITPLEKEKIKEMLEITMKKYDNPIVAVWEFIHDSKIFSLTESIEIKNNEELLFKQFDKIIYSIKNNSWDKPEEWKANYCNVDKCCLKQ